MVKKFLPVTQFKTNIIVFPERVKTKGRPTKKETNKRVPIIEKINQQATPAKLLKAKWESNSCFIDAVVKVSQRVIIPGIGATIEDDGKDNSVVTLLGRLQELSNKKNYGAMGDCQDIYHKLTDAWPLDACFSFSDQDLNLVKAFEVIRSGYSRPIGRLFSKYNKKQTEYPPEFITINDMISGTYLEDEYDYPVLFTTHEWQYELCARIFGQTKSGYHFMAAIKMDGHYYNADNMDGRLTPLKVQKLGGRMMHTIYAIYQRKDMVSADDSLETFSPILHHYHHHLHAR
ncbi:hypothetical protein BC941DRAFT_442374 [Chlamydoabsidia padenii]|nr:hypothetical protein BC941DRAFT_442374 [Chlamydoabsidia padenii]